MKLRVPRAALAAAILAVPLSVSPVLIAPASAQWIVYDPTNYAQNLLSATRALQQINNQITSLQNQAQSLINQARNLASLPYSSLQQLQQSVQRTQQLADLTAVVSANGRAQALAEAERSAAAEQGCEQRRRFLTPGVGYQPGNAQMFPGSN